MWPFKKKKIDQPLGEHKEVKKKYKKVQTIKYKDPVNFEVGYTAVNLKFLDGREFTTFVYGTVYQYINNHDLYVWNLIVTKSEEAAKQFIRSCYDTFDKTFVDDDQSPTMSISGKVISAEIGDTEDYPVDFSEAYVVEEEVEDNG